jgi:hypothetical protein
VVNLLRGSLPQFIHSSTSLPSPPLTSIFYLIRAPGRRAPRTVRAGMGHANIIDTYWH